VDSNKSDFIESGYPSIVVRKLTKKIIQATLKNFAEYNAYWLKFYAWALIVNILIALVWKIEDVKYQISYNKKNL
jgi:hypothetical protein